MDRLVLDSHDGSGAFETRVNAWTQWGRLKAVVVGRVPYDARYPATEPNFVGSSNDGTPFPAGERVPKRDIALANAELDNLAEVLAAEHVHVASGSGELQKTKHEGLLVDKMVTSKGFVQQEQQEQDAAISAMPNAAMEEGGKQVPTVKNLTQKPGNVTVFRPEIVSHDTPMATPIWQLPHQSGNGCPRDVLISIGASILESSNSRRSRAYEWQQYRPLINRLRREDPHMRHRVGPQPLRADASYDQSFFDQSNDERLRRMHQYKFALGEGVR